VEFWEVLRKEKCEGFLTMVTLWAIG